MWHAFLFGSKLDDKGRLHNKCMRFDLKKKTWDKMPPMKGNKGMMVSVCTVASYIYVFYFDQDVQSHKQNIERLRVVEPLKK